MCPFSEDETSGILLPTLIPKVAVAQTAKLIPMEVRQTPK